MMMSPFSKRGTSLSMKLSTAAPALTSIITLLGFLSFLTISSMLWAPITLVPGEGQGVGKGRESGREVENGRGSVEGRGRGSKGGGGKGRENGGEVEKRREGVENG